MKRKNGAFSKNISSMKNILFILLLLLLCCSVAVPVVVVTFTVFVVVVVNVVVVVTVVGVGWVFIRICVRICLVQQGHWTLNNYFCPLLGLKYRWF